MGGRKERKPHMTEVGTCKDMRRILAEINDDYFIIKHVYYMEYGHNAGIDVFSDAVVSVPNAYCD